ncbi:MAG TPA: MBL fold metallo-hydrolase [Candidatus Limnocylindrales bacterium]|nr:MBL fold metallo-hydrolase [Candidatus Limnocylindrales bacterium]
MKRALLVLAAVLVCLAVMVVVALRSPAMQDRLIERMARAQIARPVEHLFADDALRMIVCGSASPLPSRERGGPCIAVIAGGRFYLVDAGPGSWENMAMWRIPGERVGGVFLTHFHSDHIGELGEVNLQTWVAGRADPLRIIGPQGVERVVAGFNEAYALDIGYRAAHHGADFMPPARGRMQEVRFQAGDDPRWRSVVLEDGDLRVTAFNVAHEPIRPAVGYRFDYRGRSLVVSGDTIRNDNLIDVAREADVLAHEAQANFMVDILRQASADLGAPRLAKVFGDIPDYHTSPVEAAHVANDAAVRLLVLYHLTPPPPHGVPETIFLRGVADARSEGVELARDGLVVELPLAGKEIRTSMMD